MVAGRLRERLCSVYEQAKGAKRTNEALAKGRAVTQWCQWITPRNELTLESEARGFGPGGRLTQAIRESLGDWWWQDPERFYTILADRLLEEQ